MIAIETSKDKTLSKIQQYLKKGYSRIPKDAAEEIKRFDSVMQELTITANGIIFKDDRIVLPESLRELAINLAHRGSHPGQSGIERRLRFHFFFHRMYDKVAAFVRSCQECAIYVDKKTKEPIKSHKVPNKSWETVAVDLFGPMPSSKHVKNLKIFSVQFVLRKSVKNLTQSNVIFATSGFIKENAQVFHQNNSEYFPFLTLGPGFVQAVSITLFLFL